MVLAFICANENGKQKDVIMKRRKGKFVLQLRRNLKAFDESTYDIESIAYAAFDKASEDLEKTTGDA